MKIRLTNILNLFTSIHTKNENKNIKDSKHSPVYRKRGAEGFWPLFSFLFVYLSKTEKNMKLNFKIFLLSLMISSTGYHLHAQGIKPYIDFALVDPDNPLVAFDTVGIVVFVKVASCETNADTGGVQGNLKYQYQSDKMGFYSPYWMVEVDNDTAIETIPISGKLDTLLFVVDTNEFRTTGSNPVNVIIIWPSLHNPATPMCDSGQTVLWHVPGYYLGMEEENPQSFGSTVYPNPALATQLVYINTTYTQQISQVTITNSMGQVLSTKEFTDAETSLGYILPTQDLRAGIYHIHIYYRDKKNEVVRFIKN
jgi:hypothetical protein